MINMSSRTRLAAAASPLAVAMVLASSQPARAQAAQAANVGVTGAATQETAQATQNDSSASPAPSADDQGAIVVTGFRASIESALIQKREDNGIVDVIKAEDIAKFPDTNLAESLQRVPGVVIDRDAGEGRSDRCDRDAARQFGIA